MCLTGLGNGEYKHNPSGIFKHGVLREKQAALKELDPFPILLKSVRKVKEPLEDRDGRVLRNTGHQKPSYPA